MKNATADEILDRMLKVVGSTVDKYLAEELEISAQSLSDARRKQKVPPAWAITLAKKYPVSIDWILLGRDPLQREDGVNQEQSDIYPGQSLEAQLKIQLGEQKGISAVVIKENMDLLKKVAEVQQEALSLYRRLDEATKIEKELRAEIGAMNIENADLEAQVDGLKHQLSLSANKEDDRAHQEAV